MHSVSEIVHSYNQIHQVINILEKKLYQLVNHSQQRTKGGGQQGHCPPLGYRLRKKGRKNSEILFHSYYPKS